MKEKTVYGTVLSVEGLFLLEVEGKRHELPAGMMVDREHLGKLVGQKVPVVIGDPPIIVIDHILCYVPADTWAWVVRVDPTVRQGILDGFVKAGLLTKEKADQAMHMEG